MLLNTFAIGFTFIPFHVLRIQKRAREFSALTFARSLATLVLRIVLVMGLGLGVMGVVVADIVVTAVLMIVLLKWFAPLIRATFSTRLLRDSLAFGLPRVPHGVAHQVMSVGDRFVLGRYLPIRDVGFYSMGVSFGLIQKLAPRAPSNTPGRRSTMRRPASRARRRFSPPSRPTASPSWR